MLLFYYSSFEMYFLSLKNCLVNKMNLRNIFWHFTCLATTLHYTIVFCTPLLCALSAPYVEHMLPQQYSLGTCSMLPQFSEGLGHLLLPAPQRKKKQKNFPDSNFLREKLSANQLQSISIKKAQISSYQPLCMCKTCCFQFQSSSASCCQTSCPRTHTAESQPQRQRGRSIQYSYSL